MGGSSVTDSFDYVFSENGLVAHEKGQLLEKQDISKVLFKETHSTLTQLKICFV